MFRQGPRAGLWAVLAGALCGCGGGGAAGGAPTRVPPGPGGNPYFAAGSPTPANGTPDLDEYNDLPVAYDANVNIA